MVYRYMIIAVIGKCPAAVPVPKSHGGDRKSSGHFDHLKEPEKTAEKIAKEHNISEKTVRRAAKFAEEVDKFEPEE